MIGIAAAILLQAQPSGSFAIEFADDLVEVDTVFSGATVTLFGALVLPGGTAPGEGDGVVAIIEGPARDFTVRRMERRGVIWTPGASLRIAGAPSFHLTASDKPLEAMLGPAAAPFVEGGGGRLAVEAPVIAGSDHAGGDFVDEARAAFIRTASKQGHFAIAEGAIDFLDPPLFRISFELPPDTPVGEYAVTAHYIRGGEIAASDRAALKVEKVGLERDLYALAHERPIAYGVMCVAISVIAGWLASLVFRR